MATFSEIRMQLATHQPRLADPGQFPHHRRAAVALLLTESAAGAEILYLQRASLECDPWSGDLGFPGGHIDATDDNPRATAERETREEIGLDLNNAEFLGRLDDIAGAHLPIIVSCFVYRLETIPRLVLNHEIFEAFWFPLATLLEPQRQVVTSVDFRDEILSRPAIDLLGPGRRVLWGITYRLTAQFLCLLGHRLPPTEIP